MLVDFRRIHQITVAQAATGPNGNVTTSTDIDRPDIYDPTWGYFFFGQSLACIYQDEDTYQDVATFRITGTFTHNAEGHPNVGTSNAADEASFNALVSKFEAMESLFASKAAAAAPENYADWGTINDPRCILLPFPLRGPANENVFALPDSLRLERTQFPVMVQYVATLREAKPPRCKMKLNGVLVDDGVVSVTLPSPQFARHSLVGCSGEVLQLLHYKSMEVDIEGGLPLMSPGKAVSTEANTLTEVLSLGNLEVKAAKVSGDETVWPKLAIVDEPAIEADYRRQVLKLAVRARE